MGRIGDACPPSTRLQEFKYFRLVLMQENLYAKMLEAWEAKWGLPLVQETLSCIAMSQKGLSMQELKEIANIEEKGLLQSWEEMCDALNADLAVRSEGLLGFVYSAFRLAVERRYLQDSPSRKATQLRLAEFFERKSLFLDDMDVGVSRVTNELPYVLEEMGEWARLRNCLSNSLDVMSHMYLKDNAQDLLRFWRQGSDGVGYEIAVCPPPSKHGISLYIVFPSAHMEPPLLALHLGKTAHNCGVLVRCVPDGCILPLVRRPRRSSRTSSSTSRRAWPPNSCGKAA